MGKHFPSRSFARGPASCRVRSSRSSNTVSKTAAGSFGLRATQPDEQNEKDVSFRAFGICSWKVGSAQLRQMSRLRRMFPFALLESAGPLLESPGPQGVESAVLSRFLMNTISVYPRQLFSDLSVIFPMSVFG
jgi:hypothetical protein